MIRAMPERKRFFSIDVFPKSYLSLQDVCPPMWDGASCLPPTLAGHTAVLPCMNSFDGVFYSPECERILETSLYHLEQYFYFPDSASSQRVTTSTN